MRKRVGFLIFVFLLQTMNVFGEEGKSFSERMRDLFPDLTESQVAEMAATYTYEGTPTDGDLREARDLYFSGSPAEKIVKVAKPAVPVQAAVRVPKVHRAVAVVTQIAERKTELAAANPPVATVHSGGSDNKMS